MDYFIEMFCFGRSACYELSVRGNTLPFKETLPNVFSWILSKKYNYESFDFICYIRITKYCLGFSGCI